MKFQILSEFRDKFQKIMKIIEMLMKSAKNNLQIADNSRIPEKIQFIQFNVHSPP